MSYFLRHKTVNSYLRVPFSKLPQPCKTGVDHEQVQLSPEDQFTMANTTETMLDMALEDVGKVMKKGTGRKQRKQQQNPYAR
jgi:hypothetical protein